MFDDLCIGCRIHEFSRNALDGVTVLDSSNGSGLCNDNHLGIIPHFPMVAFERCQAWHVLIMEGYIWEICRENVCCSS